MTPTLAPRVCVGQKAETPMDTNHPHAALGAVRPSPFVWLFAVLGCLIAAGATAQTYEIVHAFRNSGQPASVDASSISSLLYAPDGYFYGTTYWGGSSGVGTIFRIDTAGNLTTLHSFAYADGANPAAGLVRVTDGNFYGTTTKGGANNLGAVFRMDAGGVVTRVASFDGATSGQDPRAALIEAADGNLYGTTRSGGANGDGTAFRIDTGGTMTTLHSFSRYVDGGSPVAELLEGADGNLFGTTSVGGTVFRMSPTGDVAVIHSFGFDTWPSALIQVASGDLLGTTMPANNGAGLSAIVSIELSGDVTILHQFDPSTEGYLPVAALTPGSDGAFYGTTRCYADVCRYGTIYRVDGSGNFSTLHVLAGDDGTYPLVAMTQGNGGFYGATTSSKWYDANESTAGTIFRIDGAANFKTVRRFGWADGAQPSAALLQAADGSLYGTTYGGGPQNLGTIFRLDPTGVVTSLYALTGPDGAHPDAAFIQATDGYLYGTTHAGGTADAGTIFRMDYEADVTTLHSFNGADEAGGPSGLIQASDGNFYGVTGGTAFRIDSSGSFATIGVFSEYETGTGANGPLVQRGGKFYGTASYGGGGGLGTVFNMSMDGQITAQYWFSGPDGAYPMAALTDVDGDLWGTTSQGGEGSGTVFKTLPDTLDLDTKHSFVDGEGGYPTGPLLWSWNRGRFYGFAGSTFTMDYDGKVTSMPGRLAANFIDASDGYVYGVGEGPLGGGGIIRFTDSALAVNEISPTSGAATGGAALVVLGGAFAPSPTVTIGGAAGTDVTVPDSTFLYLFTPALSPGTLNDVTVTNPGIHRLPATATRSQCLLRRLPRRSAGRSLPRPRREDLPRWHHGRLRRRKLLSGRRGHARADGGLSPEVRARLELRSPAVPAGFSRTCLPEPLRRLDRAARGGRHHGGLRWRATTVRRPRSRGRRWRRSC